MPSDFVIRDNSYQVINLTVRDNTGITKIGHKALDIIKVI